MVFLPQVVEQLIDVSGSGTLILFNQLVVLTLVPRSVTWCSPRTLTRLWALMATLWIKSLSGSTRRCRRSQLSLVTPTESSTSPWAQMARASWQERVMRHFASGTYSPLWKGSQIAFPTREVVGAPPCSPQTWTSAEHCLRPALDP